MRNPAREPLSERQAEIAALVARGSTNREIAVALNLSQRTVDTHVAAIFNKLGVRSRVELAVALLAPAGDSPSLAGPANGRGHKHNIPLELSSFIGREAELSELAALSDRRRLVTLTGAGGVGKTRLALRVGAAILGRLRDGVWLVDFAPLPDGAQLAQAIAAALGVQVSPNKSPLEMLGEHLRRKTLLLILDNCEHVVAEAAILADTLLRNCPAIKIIATSRESLRVAGEQTYRVPSLDVPPLATDRASPAAVLNTYDAVTLFIERAQCADHRFAATDSNVLLTGQICRQLDGIPLALELVAARVNATPLETLAEALERRFPIDTVGDRAAPPRHQTMTSLIDWSFNLLTAEEQRLFECLSVFADGFVLETAAAVYSDAAVDEQSVLELLSSLVNKSLVVADRSEAEPRYRILQTTREYTRNKVAARGEEAILSRRHALAFVNLTERYRTVSLMADPMWRKRARYELENLNLALRWTLGDGNDIAVGQRLVASMIFVWALSSTVEGRRWTRAAMETIDERTPPIVVADLQYAESSLAFALHEYELAFRGMQPLINRYRKLGDPVMCARSANVAGRSLVHLGRTTEGEALLRAALERARSIGNWFVVVNNLQSLGLARLQARDISGARAYLSEALDICRTTGTEVFVAELMSSLADVESAAGNVERAVELMTASLARVDSDGVLLRRLWIRSDLARYLAAGDRWAEARVRAREAIDIAHEIGLDQFATREYALAYVLKTLAAITALAPPAKDGHKFGRFATAARLLGFIETPGASSATIHEFNERREYDRLRGALRAALPHEELARLMADGAAMTVDQAIEEALRY